jgi:predicted PurR-regulated permease PerM
MENKKKWRNPQALLIMAIIFVLFLYMGIDSFKTNPEIKVQVDSVKTEYRQLSKFLDRKIPEIDSTLKIQANQINNQTQDIDSLKVSLSKATTIPK